MFGLVNLKPSFWDKQMRVSAPGASDYLFNYRRIWRLSILLTGVVSLVPLIFITLVDYNFTEHAMVSEYLLRSSRTVSNTRRAISFFLTERRSALDFIVHDNGSEVLRNPERLSAILENLKRSFGGGFVDLGLVDSAGKQKTYVGPYGLKDKDYSGQPWFEQVIDRGVYTSDVFLGYRNVPHLVIAVKQSLPDGSFDVLRASIGIEPFEDLLSNLELGGLGDAFIINQKGILQTNSHYHGQVLEKIPLPVPEFSDTTQVLEGKNPAGEALFIGYRFIEDTPFILMIVKKKSELMKMWFKTRLELIIFLLVSVSFILAVIIGTVTFMVNKVYAADERRLMALHQMEYSNKMASIGRMAASVAHEINNPLAGVLNYLRLMQRSFNQGPLSPDKHTQFSRYLEVIEAETDRCSKIVSSLLTFSRKSPVEVGPVSVTAILERSIVLSRHKLELGNVRLVTHIPEELPSIDADANQLQQCLLNLIFNAVDAMLDGGVLTISASHQGNPESVIIQATDTGHGISKENLGHIFEPFFTTKQEGHGIGLGLSTTYGIIERHGGKLTAHSQPNEGTTFKIELPVQTPTENRPGSTA